MLALLLLLLLLRFRHHLSSVRVILQSRLLVLPVVYIIVVTMVTYVAQ